MTFDEYFKQNFKLETETGLVRVIRKNCFNGNGLLSPISIDDLEKIWNYAIINGEYLESEE